LKWREVVGTELLECPDYAQFSAPGKPLTASTVPSFSRSAVRDAGRTGAPNGAMSPTPWEKFPSRSAPRFRFRADPDRESTVVSSRFGGSDGPVTAALRALNPAPSARL
jgi:hypothetical protein